VLVATDAPLHSDQCRRLAVRAALGIGRGGGTGENDSGDLVLAFSTATRIPVREPGIERVTRLSDVSIDPLFDAVIDATEEAVLNSMFAATTMDGRDGNIAHGLPPAQLVAILGRAEAALIE
jgi:D-aminopeptidase